MLSVAAAFGSAHERAMSADCTNTVATEEAEVSTLTSRRAGGRPISCATTDAAAAVVSLSATAKAPLGLRAPRATASPCMEPEVIRADAPCSCGMTATPKRRLGLRSPIERYSLA